MARPRFSEMLVERRRALGLSIAQASSVLKLKERALVAFEEGDFAHMPKSGYAQGMLASYSRYLGLNPRTVSQQFSRDMADWERAGGRDLARSRHVDASVGIPRREGFRGSQGLLPTSGGYAGDMGGFATTSPVRPKGQSSPLVRRGTAGADDWERRYTSRDLSSPPSRASSRYARTRTRQTRADRARRPEGGPSTVGRERIERRAVAPSDFTDDLRYGDANPYEAASTASGRRSSRNIARVDRPNVRRRSADRVATGRTGRREPARRAGVMGWLAGLNLRGTRGLAFFILFFTTLITFIIVLSVSSCIRNSNSDARATTVAVGDAASTRAEAPATQSTSNPSDASADADAPTDPDATAQESEPTVVNVKVADGEISWVEIKCDGASMVAEQVTGPWERSYTVTKSLTVSVNNMSAVTVTKNGATQSFESKTSGIGSISITGTPPAPTDAATTEAAGGDDAGKTDAAASKATSRSAAGTDSTGA
ncbi:RodZ family helix-turn-helix domain-containing protein [Olsenella sp. HMSC062G07]|uniref:helix-turn-helix domain-containing protein n=1 Tax=Olsenella sp. HMSC062G07 TaxID=1739330 RepID=UPI0008A21F9B|nr:helix-turn-helix transcriptional regulator [Olsenella sp. HMSC062G07]OFK24653.1 hypothetical protein HMPREF2826_07090 [Olsenella sp. HMSC062G07]